MIPLAHPGMSGHKLHRWLTVLVLRIRILLVRVRGRWRGNNVDSTLLISLPSSIDRRSRLLQRIDMASWRLTVLSGCHTPTPSSMTGNERDLYRGMPSSLAAGHRGCFLSHRRAWLTARSHGLTIILEDDAIPLFKYLPRFPTLPDDLDVLYLHHFAQFIPSISRSLAAFRGGRSFRWTVYCSRT